MLKKIFGTTVKTLLILIFSVIIGVGLLILVYSIPDKYAKKHVADSVSTVKTEGRYPNMFPWAWSKLDSFTDSLMMLTASYDGKEPVLEKALLAYRYEKDDMEPNDVLVAYFQNDENVSSTTYARYWHGYLVILKPLLSIMGYDLIRILNLLIQTAISILLVYLMYKKRLNSYIIPYILALLSIMPPAIAWSLQYSAIFYIFSLGSVILVLKNEKWKGTRYHVYLFLILGILTSYTDLLTYPIVTFGIPAVFYLCMNEERRIRDNIYNIITLLFYWGVGYIGMWAGKWIVASLLTEQNVIHDALYSLTIRSSLKDSYGAGFSLFEVLFRNIGIYMLNPISIAMIIFVIVFGIKIHKEQTGKKFLKYLKEFLLLLVLPFIWYLVVSNHSYIHCWFTYRDIVIFTFAGMCVLVKARECSS